MNRSTRLGLAVSGIVAALALVAATAQRADAQVGHWNSIGPSYIDDHALGTTGVLFQIALDPTSKSTIYVGSHHTQGVWKTTDGGSSWTPKTDNLPSLAVAALALDPSTPTRVYTASPGLGVYRSENGGTDWTLLSGSPSNLTDCCDTLIVDPTNSDRLFMTSRDGVYRSTDRGANWTLVNNAGQATALIMHPNHPNVLFAGFLGLGVFYSTDGGDTWTESFFDDDSDIVGNVALAFSVGGVFASPESLYAMVKTESDRRIFRSLDGGVTFQLRSTDPKYRDVIGADPAFSTIVYANYDVGGSNTFIWSKDGAATFLGQPWDSMTIGPHLDHHRFITPAAGEVYTACDGGIFHTTDFGMDWEFLGHGLANVEFYDIAVAATNKFETIGGTQDNGTIRYDGSSTVWDHFRGGDGATVAIDPTDANIVYSMGQYAPSIAREDLSAKTSECIACGLVCSSPSLCQNLHYQVHPGMHDLLLASSETSLWRADDPHCNTCPTTGVGSGLGDPIEWTAILTPQTGRILRSAVDPSVDLYYAGSTDGIIYAGPSGDNWQAVFQHPVEAAVTDIEVDPDDPTAVYVSFNKQGTGRVYRLKRSSAAPTTMDAVDMTPSTSGLDPNLIVRALAVDPGAPFTVLAGLTCPTSDFTLCQGVFRGQSIDQGTTWNWTSYNDGFPHADIVDLEVQPQTLLTRAGTFGRSAYEVATSASCSQDSDCDDHNDCNGVERCRSEGVCRAAANQVPTADICTKLLTAECSNGTSTVTLDGTCSSDPEGCSVSYQWSSSTCRLDNASGSKPQATCPLGANSVSLTVEDAVGAFSTPDTATVTTTDTKPPVVTCSVSQPVLNQTNHDLVNVGLASTATDQCEGNLPVTVKVYSNEDDQQFLNSDVANGDSPDAKGIAVGTLRLRAERLGSGNGRVYLVVTGASDSSNNSASDCCTVAIPHSMSAADQTEATQLAAAARNYCLAHAGMPPAGYFVIGDGPIVGPQQ